MDKTPPQLIACELPIPLKSTEEAEIRSMLSIHVCNFVKTGFIEI